MKITPQQLGAVHTLWDELADFPATQTDAALIHLLRKLCEWIHAGNALWIGSVRLNGAQTSRDPQNGWRGRVVRQLLHTAQIRRKTSLAIQGQEIDPGMTTCALTAGAGVFRMQRLHDGFVDVAAFKRTTHYKALYESVGIAERMWIAFPINPDVESYFVFDRFDAQPRFRRDEMELAGFVLRGIKWFHRNLMLSHGLQIGQAAMAPTEREILHLLLTDKAEKEIATAIGQTPATTHKYITGIFRKFGVKGRAGLSALWLNGR